jgi:alginate O-acetyltransferase complex protein AlgI
MLSLLPLPITWLAFYSLGRILDRVSFDIRRYGIVLVSMFLLLSAAGPVTTSFYISLGASVLLCGEILSRISDPKARKLVFFLESAALVLVLLAFLKWRLYFQKVFVYLPSLSYFSFRAIAYLSSVWKRGRIDLSAGLMQMFFFPMLFLGPISRVENFEEEFRDYREVLIRLLRGLAMLIAAHLCRQFVINELSASTGLPWTFFWLSMVANSFDFYFSFAGYSHLVIGLGILVGFKLPENFNNPYLATSISDFWRRWHMSLSYWIRDYLYIPLGGNRKGLARKCLNLVLAMTLVGIWHGLDSHYLAWGLYHGLLLATESVGHRFQISISFINGSRAISIATTFLLVSFGWLLFKYSLSDCFLYLRLMFPV